MGNMPDFPGLGKRLSRLRHYVCFSCGCAIVSFAKTLGLLRNFLAVWYYRHSITAS
jgi:hypothetical protein